MRVLAATKLQWWFYGPPRTGPWQPPPLRVEVGEPLAQPPRNLGLNKMVLVPKVERLWWLRAFIVGALVMGTATGALITLHAQRGLVMAVGLVWLSLAAGIAVVIY